MSQNGIELPVKKVEKGIFPLNDFFFSRLGNFENEILEEDKNTKYFDFKRLVYRTQLTYFLNYR